MCNAGRLKPCIGLLQTASARNPDDPEIHYRLGLAFRAAHDLNNAKSELYRAHLLRHDYKDSLLRLAELMVKSPEIQDVIWSGEHAQRVLATKADPELRSEASFTLGVAKLRLGDDVAARQQFQNALDANPAHLPAAINLAVLKHGSGDLRGAEATLEAAVQNGGGAPALAASGELYRLEGNNAKAEECFRKSLNLERGNPSARLNLAGALLAAQRVKEAEEVLAPAAAFPEYCHLHPVLLFQTGRREDALSELRTLVSTGGAGRATAGQCLQSALMVAGRYSEALALSDSALASNPHDIPAMCLRAEMALNRGDWNLAADQIGKGLQWDADSPELHFLYARLFAARQDYLRSEDELGQALRVDPRLAAARVQLARSLHARGYTRAALQTLDEGRHLRRGPGRGTRLLPDNALSNDSATLADERNWILLSDGEHTAVIAALERAFVFDRSAEMLVQRAVAGFQAGQPDARRWLDEAVRLNPAYPAALRALKLAAQHPAAAAWRGICMRLAEDCRPWSLAPALLEFPRGVIRRQFTLREPQPQLDTPLPAKGATG